MATHIDTPYLLLRDQELKTHSPNSWLTGKSSHVLAGIPGPLSHWPLSAMLLLTLSLQTLVTFLYFKWWVLPEVVWVSEEVHWEDTCVSILTPANCAYVCSGFLCIIASIWPRGHGRIKAGIEAHSGSSAKPSSMGWDNTEQFLMFIYPFVFRNIPPE